jgi:hypothetical protein
VTQDRSSFQELDLLMFGDEQLGGDGPGWVMFPPECRSATWFRYRKCSQNIHVFGQTTAVFVALAARVAAQITGFFGVALDQMRPFAGTSVSALVFLGSVLVVGVVLDDLVMGVRHASGTEVGVHAGSGADRV